MSTSAGATFAVYSKSGPNFFSKIKNKIEDNLSPKISSRLIRSSKNFTSLCSIPIEDLNTQGKYTWHNKNLMSAPTAECYRKISKSKHVNSETDNKSVSNLSASVCEKSYADSDDEHYSLDLNIITESLEDEIFQELEKSSHIGVKLDEVIQSFDNILVDHGVNSWNSNTINEDGAADGDAVYENISFRKPLKDTAYEAEKNVAVNEYSLVQRSSKNWGEIFRLNKPSLIKELEVSEEVFRLRKSIFQNRRCNSALDLSHDEIVRKMPVLKYSSLRIIKNETVYVGKSDKAEKLKDESTNGIDFKMDGYNITEDSTYYKHNTLEKNNREQSIEMPRCRKNNDLKNERELTLQSLNNNLSKKLLSNSSLKKTILNARILNKSSDSLLHKCLEKGQELLKKVESLNQPGQLNMNIYVCHPKHVSYEPYSSTHRKIFKECWHSVANQRQLTLQNLNYANEENLTNPKLESCKIIAPKLGETADKHMSLLVPVKQENLKISYEKKIERQKSHTPVKIASNQENCPVRPDGCLTISTGNNFMDTSYIYMELNEDPFKFEIPNVTNNSSYINGKAKVSGLLEQFERKAKLYSMGNKNRVTLTPPKKNKICTTKIAKIEPFQHIRTCIEIYPNFQKEVTISYH